MLEFTELLLHRWQPAAARNEKPVWTRTVCGADGRVRLGFARWQRGRWRWLGRTSMDVLETEDESLLCRLYRWGPFGGWRVCDADERLVGSLGKSRVLDQFGRLFAQLEPANGADQRFLTPGGRELAVLRPAEPGILLSFDSFLESYPFAKMLLLAAALSAELP